MCLQVNRRAPPFRLSFQWVQNALGARAPTVVNEPHPGADEPWDRNRVRGMRINMLNRMLVAAARSRRDVVVGRKPCVGNRPATRRSRRRGRRRTRRKPNPEPKPGQQAKSPEQKPKPGAAAGDSQPPGSRRRSRGVRRVSARPQRRCAGPPEAGAGTARRRSSTNNSGSVNTSRRSCSIATNWTSNSARRHNGRRVAAPAPHRAVPRYQQQYVVGLDERRDGPGPAIRTSSGRTRPTTSTAKLPVCPAVAATETNEYGANVYRQAVNNG